MKFLLCMQDGTQIATESDFVAIEKTVYIDRLFSRIAVRIEDWPGAIFLIKSRESGFEFYIVMKSKEAEELLENAVTCEWADLRKYKDATYFDINPENLKEWNEFVNLCKFGRKEADGERKKLPT